MKLNGKVAIVTGAGRGIGAAIAQALALEGASVVVNYSASEDAAREVADAITARGGAAIAVRADVGDVGQLDGLIAAAIGEYGRLDILVNNAAIDRRAPAVDATVDEWDRVMAVDLKGPFFLSQKAVRAMSPHGGAILNISSVHDDQAHRNNSLYTIAKGGMKMMTKTLALEWAESGVRVNSLSPGAILTDINRALLADDDFHAGIVAKIPLGRIGAPSDLTALAVLLVSDEASYITGATFYVDGGLML
ncbi:MAG TPA: glucose 1-dehydrogenase [Capsulimonadaceae bacterium]|jgi:glucose 1-dehydrogenase